MSFYKKIIRLGAVLLLIVSDVSFGMFRGNKFVSRAVAGAGQSGLVSSSSAVSQGLVNPSISRGLQLQQQELLAKSSGNQVQAAVPTGEMPKQIPMRYTVQEIRDADRKNADMYAQNEENNTVVAQQLPTNLRTAESAATDIEAEGFLQGLEAANAMESALQSAQSVDNLADLLNKQPFNLWKKYKQKIILDIRADAALILDICKKNDSLIEIQDIAQAVLGESVEKLILTSIFRLLIMGTFIKKILYHIDSDIELHPYEHEFRYITKKSNQQLSLKSKQHYENDFYFLAKFNYINLESKAFKKLSPAEQFKMILHEFRHYQQYSNNENGWKDKNLISVKEEQLYHSDVVDAFNKQKEKGISQWQHWEKDADDWAARQIKCPTCLKINQIRYFGSTFYKKGYFGFSDYEKLIKSAAYNCKCPAHSMRSYDPNDEHNQVVFQLEEAIDLFYKKMIPAKRFLSKIDNTEKDMNHITALDKKSGSLFLHIPQFTQDIFKAIQLYQQRVAMALQNNALVLYDERFIKSEQAKIVNGKDAEIISDRVEQDTGEDEDQEQEIPHEIPRRIPQELKISAGIFMLAMAELIRDIENTKYLEQESLDALGKYQAMIVETERSIRELEKKIEKDTITKEFTRMESAMNFFDQSSVEPWKKFINKPAIISSQEDQKRLQSLHEDLSRYKQNMKSIKALLPSLR